MLVLLLDVVVVAFVVFAILVMLVTMVNQLYNSKLYSECDTFFYYGTIGVEMGERLSVCVGFV